MRFSPLVLAIALIGISGNLAAARPSSKRSHKVRKGEVAAKKSVARTAKTVRPPVKSVPEVQHSELPAMPAIAPVSMIHMERVLPAATRLAVPEPSTNLQPLDPANEKSPKILASGIQPVLAAHAESDAPVVPVSIPQAFDPADPTRLDLLWPVETRTVSSSWGPRTRVKTVKVKAKKNRRRVKVRYRGTHRGVDLTAPVGTDVYAAMDGQILTVGRHPQYGYYVVIDHGNGVTTLYAHNSLNCIKEGEIVRRGQKIAEVGRTGNATGAHLHFELRLDGVPRNPYPVLNDVEEIPAEIMAQNQAVVGKRP